MASGKHEPLKGTMNPKGTPGEAAVPDPYGVKEQESEDGLTVAKMILGAQQGDFNTDTSKWLARSKFLARCFMDQDASTKKANAAKVPPKKGESKKAAPKDEEIPE